MEHLGTLVLCALHCRSGLFFRVELGFLTVDREFPSRVAHCVHELGRTPDLKIL